MCGLHDGKKRTVGRQNRLVQVPVHGHLHKDVAAVQGLLHQAELLPHGLDALRHGHQHLLVVRFIAFIRERLDVRPSGRKEDAASLLNRGATDLEDLPPVFGQRSQLAQRVAQDDLHPDLHL